MVVTVFRGTLQRGALAAFDFAFARLSCVSPWHWSRFASRRRASSESDARFKAEAVFSQVLRPYSGKASFGRWMCSKR